MRRFLIVSNTGSMSSIQVVVPAHIPLWEKDVNFNDGRRATSEAIAFVVGEVSKELARYAASECLLAFDPNDASNNQ